MRMKNIHWESGFGLALVGVLGTAAAHASVLVSSSFGTNAEGWTLVNWDGGGASSSPSWFAAGGDPGGYIAASDTYPDGFFRASSAFHGNWSAAYGYSLSYDVFDSYTASPYSWTDIFIVGNGNTIAYKFASLPTGSWTHFVANLTDTAGWTWGATSGSTGPLATQAQMLSVLSNVTDIRIRQEYNIGLDQSGLDNVVLTGASVPVPATLPLVGLGLLALRRRSSTR